MDDNDPISQFFPGEDSIDLYAVLSLSSDCKLEDIKKAYRRHALIYHPDKHATASEDARANASLKFQQIGFAYAVLSDEKRRTRYDKTGKTDEGFDLSAGDDGWESYFEELFDRVTRGKLDEMKKEYQGSKEETEDIKSAYETTGGDIGEIMTYIPHSAFDGEARFIVIISNLVSKGELKATKKWTASSKDEKAKLVRKKQSDKEAEEAETLAKELGVWDEFYGSGKTGQRRGKGNGKGKGKAKGDTEQEEDYSALQALILKKKEKSMDSFFDGLAAKYADPAPQSRKGKKRVHDGDDSEQSSSKKSRGSVPEPPEIDDEEFAKLQSKLFGQKAQSDEPVSKSKRKGTKKGKSGK